MARQPRLHHCSTFPEICLPMNFRHYKATDKHTCLAIFDSNSDTYFDASERAEFEAYLDSLGSDSHYFVVELQGCTVACGGFGIYEDTGSLCWGMVLRSYHGKGIGNALTRYRLNKLRQSPVVSVVKIETSQHTQAFYARHGFVVLNTVEDGFGVGIDCVAMQLSVRGDEFK
ncbi:putative GNAT family N-acyltransferase [Reinekea marinisedimentorum]|uniref:Putative GNAT family N-acyltransferase n=2 Tax=Reinekea marinisedimentorum TaxID=230495 RepID=A0A4V2UJD6_9GAMM|nr:putative GNAT family N-acyltransferase [Reinekea marinisedimentorum]